MPFDVGARDYLDLLDRIAKRILFLLEMSHILLHPGASRERDQNYGYEK